MRDLGSGRRSPACWVKGQLIGLMLLGSARLGSHLRLGGTRRCLSGLAEQLAISLENAKLYTEVQNSRIYNDILLDRLVGGVIAVNPDAHASRCSTARPNASPD
jgi:hypothetical protein